MSDDRPPISVVDKLLELAARPVYSAADLVQIRKELRELARQLLKEQHGDTRTTA